jgi:hypothetical protein
MSARPELSLVMTTHVEAHRAMRNHKSCCGGDDDDDDGTV